MEYIVKFNSQPECMEYRILYNVYLSIIKGVKIILVDIKAHN